MIATITFKYANIIHIWKISKWATKKINVKPLDKLQSVAINNVLVILSSSYRTGSQHTYINTTNVNFDKFGNVAMKEQDVLMLFKYQIPMT